MAKVRKKIKIGPIEVILASLIILHGLLILKVAFFPYPELFVYPYLAENGFLPYKDILDQHLPSLLMLPINFSDLGLRGAFSARLFSVGLVVVSHIFIFLIANKLFKNKKKAVITNILYFATQPLFEGATLWLDSFLVPLLLAAFYFSLRFLEKERRLDLVFSGLFLGFALFLKQVMAPLVLAVAVYFYYKNKDARKLFLFLFLAFLPLAFTVLWVYTKGIFSDFLFWSITFNFEVYARMGRKLPGLSQLLRTFVFWAPAFYWAFLKFKRKEISLLGIFMIFSLLTAVSRFEFVHLQPSLPFATLLTTSFLVKGEKKLKYLYLTIMLLVLGAWHFRFWQGQNFGYTHFFDAESRALAQRISQLAKQDDRIFVLGSQPTFYYLADRLPAGGIFTVNLPWNMIVAEETILNNLRVDKPKVVVRDRTASIDGVKVVDFTRSLNKFINDEGYVKVEEVGATEILILK